MVGVVDFVVIVGKVGGEGEDREGENDGQGRGYGWCAAEFAEKMVLGSSRVRADEEDLRAQKGEEQGE